MLMLRHVNFFWNHKQSKSKSIIFTHNVIMRWEDDGKRINVYMMLGNEDDMMKSWSRIFWNIIISPNVIIYLLFFCLPLIYSIPSRFPVAFVSFFFLLCFVCVHFQLPLLKKQSKKYIHDDDDYIKNNDSLHLWTNIEYYLHKISMKLNFREKKNFPSQHYPLERILLFFSFFQALE